MLYRLSREYFFKTSLRLLFVVCISLCANRSSIAQSRTLGFYLEAAKKNNPTLKDYRNQLASIHFDSLKISASFSPQVAFNGLATIAPVIGGIGYDTALTNFGSVNAVVSVSQNLFQGRTEELQQGKLQAQRLGISNSAQISEYDLQRNITAQYATAYSDLLSYRSGEEAMKLVDEQLRLLTPLVSQGVYQQVDFLNLKITRGQQQINLDQLKIQYRADLYRLNQLCGLDENPDVTLEEPALLPIEPVALWQSLYKRQYSIDSLSNDLSRSLLDRDYAPKFGWFADAGLFTSQPKYAYRNLGFSAGLNLSIPIYDGNRRSYEQQKLDIAQSTLDTYSQAFIREYGTQRRMLRDQLASSDTLITRYQEQLQSIDELIHFYTSQLQHGNLKMTDFLLAFNTMIATRASLNQARIARVQIISQLNYLNH